jgi:hypothetical protein
MFTAENTTYTEKTKIRAYFTTLMHGEQIISFLAKIDARLHGNDSKNTTMPAVFKEIAQ